MELREELVRLAMSDGRTRDGRRCDPLSLSDLASRYVPRLQAVAETDGDHVWPVPDAAFREFGPPLVMRSDNGPPFASVGVGGLSWLSVRLIKAGVMAERIAPGKPRRKTLFSGYRPAFAEAKLRLRAARRRPLTRRVPRATLADGRSRGLLGKPSKGRGNQALESPAPI